MKYDNLWVVIPAAGQSQRFKEAGFHTPKPLLKIEDRDGLTLRMVTHVLASLPNGILHNPIVALPYGEDPVQPFYKTVYIKHTMGQADTLYQMLQELPYEDSVLVLDCDMLLDTKDLMFLIDSLQMYDVTIAVTKTFDPNASRVDSIPYPTRFVEKEPISEYGIVGARAFRNIGKLSDALHRTIKRYRTIGQEPYLSVAINHYPGTKFAHEITKYEDWGTPARILESGARIMP